MSPQSRQVSADRGMEERSERSFPIGTDLHGRSARGQRDRFVVPYSPIGDDLAGENSDLSAIRGRSIS